MEKVAFKNFAKLGWLVQVYTATFPFLEWTTWHHGEWKLVLRVYGSPKLSSIICTFALLSLQWRIQTATFSFEVSGLPCNRSFAMSMRAFWHFLNFLPSSHLEVPISFMTEPGRMPELTRATFPTKSALITLVRTYGASCRLVEK